ncbi:Putative HrgA like protein [Helicobacter bizzozeronii]|uniref:HrgA protein n=1 Tax=Helicobacter bizzozeronii TaxID=56877 RepID=UPI00244D8FCC|nr:HrgA protein [Helicobacter bizzozeronii]GMB93665.1 Putative HrgA like protein [Helicobacter bizzozeronii]
MKKETMEITLEVLKEAKGPVSIYDLYDRAEELYNAGKIQHMYKNSQRASEPISRAFRLGEDLPFVKVTDYPITIALKEYAGDTGVEHNTQAKPKKNDDYERRLHHLVAYFAYHKWGTHTKTINHNKANKARGGKFEWLYPDMVGASFAYKSFEPALREFVEKFDNLPLKLFSFELKKEITLGTCREYYFQAISNSSWAHEGYLVTEKLDIEDNDLMDLLKRLHASFGIGVVLLNVKDISKSRVLLNARFKESLDHTMLVELSKNSPDFKEFLKTLSLYHSTIRMDMSEQATFPGFDQVPSPKSLEAYIKTEILKIEPQED